MDTGASTHMNSSVGILQSRLPVANSSILVGNGAHIPVTARGSSILDTNSTKFLLNNILVAPSLVRNLLSVHQFTRDNGGSIEFDAFGFSVKEPRTGRVILRCNSSSDLYTVSPAAQSTANALLAASSSVWHRRLGHPGPAVLASLKKNNLISCNKLDRTLCHACQLGKHARLPFSSSGSQTVLPFEIVHCDVWTSPVPSISGCSYYLVFLDDFTHFCWTFPLKHKSEVRQHFADFIPYVRTQFGFTIKCFQADNGTEFVNHAMHDILAAQGIVFHLSCPYTSQQNSKAERVLRTLNNSVRTLLLHASMPPKYWAEALAAATYLLNRRPSSSIRNEVPYTRLYKSPPSYEHLRIFGCLCYPNLQATSPHKLALRSTACVFLGYPSDHKGYRCLDLSTRRIIISRHVVFDELSFPFARDSRTPASSFDFLLRCDLDIAPCSTDHADHAAGGPSPTDAHDEHPRSSLGGRGPVPLPSSDVPSPGGCGSVPPSGPLDASSPGGCGLVPPSGSVDDTRAAAPSSSGTVAPADPSSSAAAPAVPPPGFPPRPADHPSRFKGVVYSRHPASTRLSEPPDGLPLRPSEPATPESPSPSPVLQQFEPRRPLTRTQSGAIPPVRYVGLSTTATTTLMTVSPIPANYCSGLSDPNWRAAMAEEYQALIDNGTWQLVPRPPGANVVSEKWIFKHKYHSDGTLARHKARWVVRGFSQQHGVDYDETFSSVVKPPSIRTVLSIAASCSWPVRQLDVKNAFLHGHLEETVYCQQPPGFVDPAAPDHVCLLQRSLYGLKQAPRAWYQRFATFIRQLGFASTVSDVSLFVYNEGDGLAYLLLYVDDIIVTASSPALL